MAIRYYSEQTRMPRIRKRIINDWIKAIAGGLGKKVGEIACIFCSDNKILELNQQYLKHDYYTDIITFGYSGGQVISGDIFISLDTVQSNAGTFHTSYPEELHRTIIHGILHLCGIDDKAPEEREAMREMENKALSLLPEEACKNLI